MTVFTCKNFRYIACLVLLCTVFLLSACTTTKEKQLKAKEEGIAQLGSGEYEAAVASFDKALAYSSGKVTKDEIDICYYKAAAQYNSGDFTGAVETYTALVDYDKDNYQPVFLRGCIYLNEKEYEKALADFKEAVKRNDSDYDLYIAIYENLKNAEQEDVAGEFLNMALESFSDDKEGLVKKGRIYIEMGQYDLAVECLRNADKKGSEEANIYLAEVYYDMNKDEKADELIAAYKNEKNLSALACNAIGQLELKNGNYESAGDYFKKGLKTATGSEKKILLKNQIAAYEYMSDFDKAMELAEKYLETYPTDTDVMREITFLKTR